jgi:hypothetical protein
MQYVFLIHEDERSPVARDEKAMAGFLEEYGRFSEEVNGRGIMRGGARLRHTDAATTVRVRDGKTMLTDGPFAETKEQLGGFYILDCKDLDEALSYAAKIPSARHGSIEVRPVWEMGE